jgi:hypothetical protein
MHCYICGSKLKEGERHVRKLVWTGLSDRFRYAPTTLTNRRASFGMRVVCTRCQRWGERAEIRQQLLEALYVAIALGALLILALLR